MKAIVVYESHWGNTAAIAKAIAKGIGSGAQALATSEAVGAAIADVDLVVAGAPLLGFTLPNEQMLAGLKNGNPPSAPDLSHPAMRTWLASLPKGQGLAAAFETRIWWSPGSAASIILRELAKAGYQAMDKGQRFIVKGKYGPLREGELERAQAWGAQLALAKK